MCPIPPPPFAPALLALALLALALAGRCGAADPPPAATGPWAVVEETTGRGQRVLTLVPDGHDPAAPTPLVIYHHGRGENRTAVIADRLKAGVVTALAGEGWLIAGCDAGGDNWGGSDALGHYVDLYEHVSARHEVSAVLHLSQSMGGLTGLQAVAGDELPAAGWCGIYPVCSIGDMHQVPRFAAAIEERHGGTDWAGRDPVRMPPERFAGVPLLFFASYGETVVGRAANADAMAGRVRGVTSVEVVDCDGDHGHPSHFRPAKVVEFFRGCLAE